MPPTIPDAKCCEACLQLGIRRAVFKELQGLRLCGGCVADNEVYMATYCVRCLKFSKKAVPASNFISGVGPVCGACKVDYENTQGKTAEMEKERLAAAPQPMAEPGPKGPKVVEVETKPETKKESVMELCEICKGENRRPKGHTGRHVGQAGADLVKGPKPAKAAKPGKVIVHKARRGGTFQALAEAIASEIAALDARRKKLAAALEIFQDLDI